MEKGDTDLASFLRTHPRDSEEALTPKAIAFFWAEMLRCVRVIHQHGRRLVECGEGMNSKRVACRNCAFGSEAGELPYRWR